MCRDTTVYYFLYEFHSFECYQFVAGEDNGGKYIEFTGRSTKNFKEGLAHWKLYNKQIRHYGQPGKSYSVYKTCFFHNFISREYWICPFHLITYLKTCLVTSCMHDPELFPLRGGGTCPKTWAHFLLILL